MATVLIADDEADLREYLADLFRARGCTVTVVADGIAALDAIGDGFDVAIISLLLPEASGFRVLSEYKARGGAYAIMTSAMTSTDHAYYAAALGADLFLTKPFNVEDVLAAAMKRWEQPATLRAMS